MMIDYQEIVYKAFASLISGKIRLQVVSGVKSSTNTRYQNDYTNESCLLAVDVASPIMDSATGLTGLAR